MSVSYAEAEAEGSKIEVRMHGAGSTANIAAITPAPAAPIVCVPSMYRERLRRWSNFKSQARRRNKSRGITVTISQWAYFSLITQPCAYCGARPPPGKFVGVDRLRSDGIYSWENCTPCCKICNFMKGSLSVPQFFAHIQAIVAHQRQTLA